MALQFPSSASASHRISPPLPIFPHCTFPPTANCYWRLSLQNLAAVSCASLQNLAKQDPLGSRIQDSGSTMIHYEPRYMLSPRKPLSTPFPLPPSPPAPPPRPPCLSPHLLLLSSPPRPLAPPLTCCCPPRPPSQHAPCSPPPSPAVALLAPRHSTCHALHPRPQLPEALRHPLRQPRAVQPRGRRQQRLPLLTRTSRARAHARRPP